MGEVNNASPRDEWRDGWPLVAVSVIGISLTVVHIFSIGLFFEPLEKAFGWSRSQISFGLTIHALIAVPLLPFFGILVDRWGARRIAIPGIALYGLGFASLALTTGSALLWWAQWAVLALLSLAITPTLWVMAVSSRFVTSRGLALAVILSGSAISSALAPSLSRWLIDEYHWRQAYLYLGLGWAGLTLLLALPFFFDARDQARAKRKATDAAPPPPPILPGLSLRQAMRSANFLKLVLASFLASITVMSTTIHLFPILTMRGLSRETAAEVFSVLGIAAIAGKVSTGWLFDHLDARKISAALMMLPIIPLLSLAMSPEGQVMSVALAIMSVAFIGITAGAELSMTAYLTTRYVGLRAFGQNYGVIASVMGITAGLGPPVAGFIYDKTGSYVPWLYGIIPGAIGAALLILSLGPFPIWPKQDEEVPV